MSSPLLVALAGPPEATETGEAVECGATGKGAARDGDATVGVQCAEMGAERGGGAVLSRSGSCCSCASSFARLRGSILAGLIDSQRMERC